MPYIKSHSNYALKKKHQIVDDGTVFERDITTIGAVNQFAPGQTPIYRSGNFIITVRADRGGTNQYNTQKWEQSNNSGETWTLSNITDMVSKDENQDDTKIVLKNDYYDFRDFAYYGSLTELFRSSMNDILDRFPGELYCIGGETGIVYYTSSYTEDLEAVETNIRLGGEGYYEISNPYGINIHSAEAPKDTDPLKYFANSGYKKYTINGSGITSWNVSAYTGTYEYKSGEKKYSKITTIYSGGSYVSSSTTAVDKAFPCVGDKIADITINNNEGFYAYIGDNDVVYYLHSSGQTDTHITPAGDVITEFYNGCSDFERIILNPNTSPKYKAIFSVISETDYGYTRELEEFVFPTSAGGYNPATESGYIDRLVTIGEFYDENLTDNLYRSMTHEAIKNFDWSYTREYDEDAEEEHFEGGQKIQKALRVFAREFDEQKKYIDNIKNTGRITYDDRANIPDYFLADVCEDDGWDIKSVIPYDLKDNGNDWTNVSNILNNVKPHVYSQSSKPTVTPYSSSYINDGTAGGYFINCSGGKDSDITCHLSKWYSNIKKAGDKTYITAFPSDRLEYKIKPYSNTANTYTYMDVNNEFLKRLKLNSRAIWRHKGTLEGIEMILGMFGLKSKRWLNKSGSFRYSAAESCTNIFPDYEIIEYTQFTSPIEDKWDDEHNMYEIDWINSTKTITYDNRSTSNYTLPGSGGINYTPYQGLPVAYLDKDGKRYLYPNFNKNEQLDGNPYFQMDGGWLAKTISDKQNFQFDADDNIVHNPVSAGTVVDGFVVDNQKLYKETVRSIRRVENLRELLSIPQSELYDGIICYVGRIDDETAIIDGEAFTIEYDDDNNKYVRFVRKGGFVKVGGLYFDDDIVVLGSNLEPMIYSLDDKLDGYEIKAYINGESFTCKSAESDQYSIHSFKIVRNDDEDYSNYFKLNDTVFSDMITYSQSEDGWTRLKTTDRDYRKINTIYNYYEGNNGHNGNMKYDSGHEYFTYFQRLFKYAEDNDLFDTRCYSNGYNDLYVRLHPDDKPIGFTGLTHSNEDVTDYDSYMSADTKVHYFGNYKTRKGGTSNDKNDIDKIYIYGAPDEYTYPCDDEPCSKYNPDGAETCDPWKCFYGGKEPTYYQINGLFHIVCLDGNNKVVECLFPANPDTLNTTIKKNTVFPEGTTKIILNTTKKVGDGWEDGWVGSNGETISTSGYYHKTINLNNEGKLTSDITNELQYLNCRTYGEAQPHTSTDPVTNQIVNNKRIRITFNMKNDFNSKQGQIELKYIDDIVMNYLTQLIPSTAIVEIEYNFSGFNNKDC